MTKRGKLVLWGWLGSIVSTMATCVYVEATAEPYPPGCVWGPMRFCDNPAAEEVMGGLVLLWLFLVASLPVAGIVVALFNYKDLSPWKPKEKPR